MDSNNQGLPLLPFCLFAFLSSCFLPSCLGSLDRHHPPALMEKRIGQLLDVIRYFQTNSCPSDGHNQNWKLACALFPNGGCSADDDGCKISKRKGACAILTQIHDTLGFETFLLFAFAFEPTALYDIKKLDPDMDMLCSRIKNSICTAPNFGIAADNFRAKQSGLFRLSGKQASP